MTTWVGLAASLLLVATPLYRAVGSHLLTLVHESGHAVMTLARSGRVTGVRVFANGTGVTHGVNNEQDWFLVSLAGYLAPAAVGLGGLMLLHQDHQHGALVTLLVLVGLIFLFVRNLFGALVLLVAGGVLFLCLRYASDPVQAATASILAWTLLLGAVRDSVSLCRVDEGSDAHALEDETGLPFVFWAGFFVLATTAALGYAAWLSVTGW